MKGYSLIATRDFMLGHAFDQLTIKAPRRSNGEHKIKLVRKKLRGMMPWISNGKMVDKARN